ncbi:Hypp1920 [Branchiostoma lanceolatum]|uniref:Hypp1920 protein n=1 Tax=Branchiostoma lanceolatum TaxID=7740 RepID=A0A8J9ZM04_BRALA|nr:Hypp1920 [Branchiostoma lanceolatum]
MKNTSPSNFFSAVPSKYLGVMRICTVLLVVGVLGTSGTPIPTTPASGFPQESPFDVLMNDRSIADRLYRKADEAYTTFFQDEFEGNSGYCAEQITWDELISVRMTPLEWRNLGDEERMQRMRSDLQIFGQYLEEVKLDELDKEGHTDTANKVDETIHQLDTLMTAIDVTNNALGFSSPTDTAEIQNINFRDPFSEFARSIRDCVVLRDFRVLVQRVHRDFTLLSQKYQ